MIRLFLRPFDERGTALGLLFARYSSSRSAAAAAVSACGLPETDCRSAPGGPSFIDIGANLLGEQFSGIYRGARKHEPDMRAILDRSSRAGLTHIMITASNLRDSVAALSMIRSHAAGGVRLFTTVGVHPTNTRRELEDAVDGEHPTPCGNADAYFSALDAVLADGVSDGSVVAIGEAGLDFEPDREKMSPREVQLRHFPRHFALAEKYDLPIFFHERDASEDFLRASATAPTRKGRKGRQFSVRGAHQMHFGTHSVLLTTRRPILLTDPFVCRYRERIPLSLSAWRGA
jgi:Tat protein secretion system quality control protein TatD with DNase activity